MLYFHEHLTCTRHSESISCLAGVAESVLARVLDAFQAHMTSTLSGSAVQGLVSNGTLARLMAAEPAASLAGDPVAFFAGRPGDSIDAFVTEVVTAGGQLLGDLFQNRSPWPTKSGGTARFAVTLSLQVSQPDECEQL